MSEPYKDWIVRFYANHNDIPEGHSDGGIVGELIRCKDCVFNHGGECWGFGDGHLVCDDDYCSGGERKEE